MMFRKLIAIAAMFMGAFTAFSEDNSLNTTALLKSIGEVETGGQYWKIGAAGERSLYQIKSSTWVRYSSIPFWRASQKSYQDEAERVARCYISEIVQTVERPTAKNVALRWNGGMNRSRFHSRTISYANRVANLYDSYRNSSLARHVEPIQIVQAAPLKITINLDEKVEPVLIVIFSTTPPTQPRITISTEPNLYLPVVAMM